MGGDFIVNLNNLPVPPGGIIAAYEPAVAFDGGTMAFAWTDIFGDALPTYPKLVVGRTLSFATATGSVDFFVDNPYSPYPFDPETGEQYSLQQSHTSVAISNDGRTYAIAYAQNSLAIDLMSDDPYRMNVFARAKA